MRVCPDKARAMNRLLLSCILLLSFTPAFGGASDAADADPVRAALERFVADYRRDPMLLDADFGIRVGERWFHVSARRSQTPVPHRDRYTFHRLGPHQATLAEGQPSGPTWFFDLAAPEVLADIDAGRITAGTAAMRSFASDRAMVGIADMPGFASDPGDVAAAYHAMTHFWARGVPEVTRFSREASLPTHGASLVALHTEKDKRLAWFSIGPEEAANDDPRLESGQVPNLFIVVRGRGVLESDDGPVPIEAGTSVFVAPYVRHVIRNTGSEPLEGVLVLFGDNGDFVHGRSWPDHLDALHGFLGGGARDR